MAYRVLGDIAHLLILKSSPDPAVLTLVPESEHRLPHFPSGWVTPSDGLAESLAKAVNEKRLTVPVESLTLYQEYHSHHDRYHPLEPEKYVRYNQHYYLLTASDPDSVETSSSEHRIEWRELPLPNRFGVFSCNAGAGYHIHQYLAAFAND